MKIRKAVIPAAGLGTRMLPATKTIPKELLPLVDKPVLHYIVEEAVLSGVEEIIIITSPGKSAMDDYFRPAPELYDKLIRVGKTKEAEMILRTSEMAKFTFVEQLEQKGLGHAVWCAREAVGNEPFGVLLGDDIMLCREKPVLRQLIDAAEKYSCSAIATREVDDEHIVKYSSLKISPMEERIYSIADMNEKPTLAEKFSNNAIMGRYVLTPDIFDILEKTAPGRNGEIQLTDGLRELCLRDKMIAVDFMGKRYDTGNPKDYVETFLDFALADEEVGEFTKALILNKAKEIQ
jgi:UTP--glucose-1-phosphate uridylyltransferase